MFLSIFLLFVGCVIVGIVGGTNGEDFGQPQHLLLTGLSSGLIIFGSYGLKERLMTEYETHTTVVNEKDLVTTEVTENGDTLKVYKNARIK